MTQYKNSQEEKLMYLVVYKLCNTLFFEMLSCIFCMPNIRINIDCIINTIKTVNKRYFDICRYRGLECFLISAFAWLFLCLLNVLEWPSSYWFILGKGRDFYNTFEKVIEWYFKQWHKTMVVSNATKEEQREQSKVNFDFVQNGFVSGKILI